MDDLSISDKLLVEKLNIIVGSVAKMILKYYNKSYNL